MIGTVITLITCKHWSMGLISYDSPQWRIILLKDLHHLLQLSLSLVRSFTLTLCSFLPHYSSSSFVGSFRSLSLSLSLMLSLRFFDSSVLSHLSFIPSLLGLISCFVLWIGRFRFHFPPLHSFSCSTSPLISMKIRMEGVRKEEVGGWRPGGEMMKMTCLCNLGLCWYAVITWRRRRNGNLIGQWQSCWQSTIFFKEKHQCCCHCCKTVVSQVTRVLLTLPQNQQLEEQPEGYCC